MKDDKKKRLVLNRETIRSLTERELEDVNAASGVSCYNSWCCCNTSVPPTAAGCATDVTC